MAAASPRLEAGIANWASWGTQGGLRQTPAVRFLAATWRLPHRRNGAVLLSANGAVYSGIGDVRTVGARTIFERGAYLYPLPFCDGLGMTHRLGMPLKALGIEA